MGNVTEKQCCGVLTVHGICGNPRIFNMFVPLQDERVIVENLVLEGHGGNALDFSRGSMRRWKEQVAEAVELMRGRCRRVVIAGHSMGCLLALEEAFKGSVDGVFLLCPPLKIRVKPSMPVNSIKVTLGMFSNDPVIAAAKDAYGIRDDFNLFHYYGWPARYMELFAESRRVRDMLRRMPLKCRVRAFLCGKDDVVSPRSAQAFECQEGCSVSLLPESTHYYFTDADKERLRESFAEFLACFF